MALLAEQRLRVTASTSARELESLLEMYDSDHYYAPELIFPRP